MTTTNYFTILADQIPDRLMRMISIATTSQPIIAQPLGTPSLPSTLYIH